jgi:hypothetical protein
MNPRGALIHGEIAELKLDAKTTPNLSLIWHLETTQNMIICAMFTLIVIFKVSVQKDEL